MSSNRDHRIETLRGLAIILMVFGHVIGPNPHMGMRQPEGSLWHMINTVLMPIRMPLFAAISGYIFAMSRKDHPIGSVITRKAHRLLLPLLCVGFLHRVFLAWIAELNWSFQDYFVHLYLSFSQFWFLHAMFFIFVVVMFWRKLASDSQVHFWLLFSGSILMFLWAPTHFNIMSFSQTISIFPGFLLGYGFYRFQWGAQRFLVASTAILCLGLYMLHHTSLVTLPYTALMLTKVLAGLGAAYSALGLKFYFRPLAKLGDYSFGIFLFHYIVLLSLERIIKVPEAGLIFYAVVVTSLAVLVPVFIEKAIRPQPALAFFLLGRGKISTSGDLASHISRTFSGSFRLLG